MGRDWKRRIEHGIVDEPLEYKAYKDGQWCATEVKSKVFGWMSTITHFISELSDVSRTIGFRDVQWDYKGGTFTGKKLSIHENPDNFNVFMRKDIDYKFGIDNNIPENFVREEIKFLTIVAKK